jgi:hypothetical protein
MLAWRQRYGLPVEMITIIPYGKARVGAGRSTF